MPDEVRRVRAAVVAAVVAHAREARPRECCGILIGHGDEIMEAVPAANLAEDVNRFLLDPKTYIEARRSARHRGLAVVGFYHSHPHSSAQPSPRDLAESTDDEALHLIVSLMGEPPVVRLFTMKGDASHEVPFVQG
jgi:proteasome lid subunit RPN8/RPN11